MGPGNDLVQNKQQAVVWTNDDQVLWCHVELLGYHDCSCSEPLIVPIKIGEHQINWCHVISIHDIKYFVH